MTKSKLKNVMLSILCIFCLLPVLVFTIAGKITYSHSGGPSTMGVIIGPIVGLDGLVSDGTVSYSADYSSSNLSRDTPYADGALRAYKNLGVYNIVRDSGSWNGFKYASYIRFFRIIRNDGRPIYDDDGILDVSSDKNNLADEVVNYPSYIFVVETTLPIKSKAGFLWTDEQAIFKEGTELRCEFGYTNSSGTYTYVYDVPTEPTNKTENLATIMFKDYTGRAASNNNLRIILSGTGRNRNTFWGGSGGDVSVYADLTSYIALGKRNWSNTLTASGAAKSKYNGKTAYYMAKPYTAIASNLDNYIKINDVQATPQYGTSVAPYRDGHHIAISGEGYTKVDIENGSEGSYTTYYCFVDTTLPDVSFNYHNTNALDTQRAGSITTATNGAKTQTTTGAIFKDEVQINFGYNADSESPESATYTYGGNTYNLTSGTWLKNEGSYTVTVKDLAGNTSIYKFTIDKSSPSYNLNRLQTDTTYKISKWYLTTIPYGYSNSGTYSFKTYQMAQNFAFNSEKANCVTQYTLTDINAFTATNLVANGNAVKLGDYWNYKSRDNPNLYVYYFDENSLKDVISYYSSKFVEEQVYKINSSLSPNNYGNTIDQSVYDNIIDNGYIANNFVFKQQDTNESNKIYYDYQGDSIAKWVEFNYNTKFTNVVTTQGLYKIKEVDYVGHETTYFVYVDLQAPLVDYEAKNYGSTRTIRQTISKNDIPNSGELVYYYETFKIVNIFEDDTWWTLEVKCPDGTTKRYTYLDTIPAFEDLGSGEFNVIIADRTNTSFKFKVYLLGKAPQVKFETINANSQMKITITAGENYNQITDIKIFRNGICLNSENGYDEYPDRTDDEHIYISPTTLRYTFGRGGIYVVELTDNFGRTLSFEYKFEKDLPTGILSGVEHNGRTKDQVQFTYNSNKYFVVVTQNNNTFSPEQAVDRNITTLTFYPEENTEFAYSITLYDNTDTDNYNSYNFIKTVKPIIYLFGVEPNGKTGGDVYASWDNSDEQYTAIYSNNGCTYNYRKGQVLTGQGHYIITLTDELENYSQVNFEIDKTIDFIISDTNNNVYSIEGIEFINFDIKLIAQEPLDITLTKNNTKINYEFGLMITDEGYYTVEMFDEFHNTIFFSFTIDKTAPKATLYGVENYGVTSGRVWVAAQESGLNSWYVKDNKNTIIYKLGNEIVESGNYIVYVADKAKNTISFEFSIDTEISYDINTYYGGISNGGVRIVAYENLKIVMFKNDKPIEYEFEQILNEDGEYSFTLADELGNRTSFFFTIISKKQQNLKHILQENISVTSVLKDGENYEVDTDDNQLYLVDEGIYKVEILDSKTNKNYDFQITIDTTPPTLELIGVENGGTTKKVVVMKNVSEKPYNLYITVDGVPFEYKLGDEIEKCGRFVVVLTDEAGNSTTYTFERVYSLNGPSIAVLAGLGALVVLIIILLVKSRKRYDEDVIVEEEIEETIIEDENANAEDSENDENGTNE